MELKLSYGCLVDNVLTVDGIHHFDERKILTLLFDRYLSQDNTPERSRGLIFDILGFIESDVYEESEECDCCGDTITTEIWQL